MCGIAGIVAAEGLHLDDSDRVTRMRDVIAHRGPDDAGLFVDGQAALGHRRLSIVDLPAGHQPLANEDQSIWIVFNGEIYNHQSVREVLEPAGHRYKTRSDTETILHAYAERRGETNRSSGGGNFWLLRAGTPVGDACCSLETASVSSRCIGRRLATVCF